MVTPIFSSLLELFGKLAVVVFLTPPGWITWV